MNTTENLTESKSEGGTRPTGGKTAEELSGVLSMQELRAILKRRGFTFEDFCTEVYDLTGVRLNGKRIRSYNSQWGHVGAPVSALVATFVQLQDGLRELRKARTA
jgi:hypothetical protein